MSDMSVAESQVGTPLPFSPLHTYAVVGISPGSRIRSPFPSLPASTRCPPFAQLGPGGSGVMLTNVPGAPSAP